MTFPVEDSIFHYFNDVAPLSDGGFVLCGTMGSPTGITPARALLVKLEPGGDVAWWQSFVHARELFAVREMPDGGFAAAGYRSSAPDRSVLMRNSSSGAIQWIRYTGALGYGATNVRVDDVGAVVTWSDQRTSATDPYSQIQVLTKRDSAGDVVWEWNSAPGNESSATDFEVLSDGGFVTTGTRGGRGIITRHDVDGLPVWSRDYRLLHGQHSFSDVEPTTDGGYVLTGSAWRYVPLDPGILTNELTWVVKVDSLGCVVPGCHTVGVQEYALDLNEHLRMAPNPVARGQALRITFEPPPGITAHGPLRLILLDGMGREVMREAMNGAVHNLLTHNLASGLYYLHLTDDVRWLAGSKLVVE